MTNVLTAAEIQDMIRHWLSTPPNGYLGDGYGADVMSLLQLPLADASGDAFLAKMQRDIPVIGALPPGAVDIYMEADSKERKTLYIEVFGSRLSVNQSGEIQ